MRVVGRPHLKNEGGISVIKKKEETDSLAHTKWNCKYHIVFAPKYRRQVIYGQIRSDIGVIIRKLCEYKGVEIIEAEACPDHIHMLVDCRPQFYISDMIKIMKGNLARQMFLVHPELKKELWGGHLWNPSYCAVTVSDRSREQVSAYIEGQKEKEKRKL